MGTDPATPLLGREIPRTKRPKYLSDKRASGAGTTQLAPQDHNPHTYLYLRLALGTRIRLMEIFSLRKEDLLLDKLLIDIRESKTGRRQQPISAELAACLSDFLSERGNKYLFSPQRPCTEHLKEIRKPFCRVIEKAGLDPKQVLTHLVQAGVDLPTVKRISGHKTLQMVERYPPA